MNKDALRNEIWDIKSIVSDIFTYVDIKDLLEFNIACKQWNTLTNSMVHKSVKLLRKEFNKLEISDEKRSKATQIDMEVCEFIANNSKYSRYIKQLNFCESIKPERAIEFIETLNCLTKIQFSNVEISQDQFICMVKPLNKLEELILSFVTVKEIFRKRLCIEAIQLPPTLAKLSINHLTIAGNAELFVQSINSHVNLKEFEHYSYDDSVFITPFYKHYPSLQYLTYSNQNLKSPEYFIKIFESNPQLLNLKLWIECSNDELSNSICKNLTKLEKFEMVSYTPFVLDDQEPHIKFCQPTNIRKLALTCANLSSDSFNSILQNCPVLEEFILGIRSYVYIDYLFSLNLEKNINIKKLKITYPSLTESSLDSILLNCPRLEELDISFPRKWKGYSEVISRRCFKLKHLSLYKINQSLTQDYNNNLNDYNSLRFLLGSFQFKSTLISLKLKSFNFKYINSAYFQNFPKLKVILFTVQNIERHKNLNEIDINMDLWPSYKLKKTRKSISTYDIKLVKRSEIY
jgi:hypothetical protein